MENRHALAGMGWTAHFEVQLTDDDTGLRPARVTAVHRDALEAEGAAGPARILQIATAEPERRATVGDWVLYDPATLRTMRVLDRRSVFKRRAAGTGLSVQLIAANIDTLFVVSSCNADFNPPRLERFLALARQAGVMPLVVLTKADLADDVAPFREAAQRLARGVLVECLDARSPEAAERLSPWCVSGQTVALLGMSGVGKSTIVNTLIGAQVQETRAIREDDARGRHTTTGRSLHRMESGGWLLDTPGMRLLRLADSEEGIRAVFDDVESLARDCRFGDCTHVSEPGCAVVAALETGALQPVRLKRYRKLLADDARNSASLAEQRARSRAFGRMARNSMARKRALRGETP